MRNLAFLVVILSLSACMSVPKTSSGKDGGPRSSVDLSTIPDADPKPVKRTKAGNYSPYTVLGKTYEVLPSSNGFVEEGTASWYGSKFHGRLTSNGERFDMYAMTAAHKHLPIPTYVEVTNLDNGRKAVLRVNDRGPFHGDRVIDLSWAAAARLGFSNKGTAPVRVVALDPVDPHSTLAQLNAGQSTVQQSQTRVELQTELLPEVERVPEQFVLDEGSYYQVAALSRRDGADKMAAEIEVYTKLPVRIEENAQGTGTRYRVLIGPLLDRREVNMLGMVLELGGLSPGFIVRLDK